METCQIYNQSLLRFVSLSLSLSHSLHLPSPSLSLTLSPFSLSLLECLCWNLAMSNNEKYDLSDTGIQKVFSLGRGKINRVERVMVLAMLRRNIQIVYLP